MKVIKIFDGLFSHVPYSCLNCKSDYIEWDFNPSVVNDGDIVVFTDLSLNEVFKFKNLKIKKIAWLLESPVIVNQNSILNLVDEFDEIFTFREDFLNLNNKFKFVPYHCSWIQYENRNVYEKNKNLSIIVSEKKQTEGHILRHQIVERYKKDIDIYGRGYKFVSDKLDALKDYRFSIVVENTKKNYYFTEKLLDCFVTGTIPIYWGCPKIGDFFNEKGIITFNNIDELNEIIINLSDDKYKEMLSYAHENFLLTNKYKTPEDFFYNNYLNI